MGILLKLVLAVGLGVVGPISALYIMRHESAATVSFNDLFVQSKQKMRFGQSWELGAIFNPTAYYRSLSWNLKSSDWKHGLILSIWVDSDKPRNFLVPVKSLSKMALWQKTPSDFDDFNMSLSNRVPIHPNSKYVGSIIWLDGANAKSQRPTLTSNEGISRSSSFVSRALGFPKSSINQPYPYDTQNHASDRSYTHNTSPQRGLLLRYEIVILALIIAGFIVGCALCIKQAPRLLSNGHNVAGLSSLFVGVTGIFVGTIVGSLLISSLL